MEGMIVLCTLSLFVCKKLIEVMRMSKMLDQARKYEKEEEKKAILKKTCQRVFQAIRIDVNSEFEVLDAFLQKLPFVLNPGGKAAVLTFHSGEDRMVKKAFRAGRGIYYKEVSKDVIRPSARECRENGRARSTKMRWAVAMGGKE